MQKKMLLLLVILIVVVGIFAFFVLRHQTEKPNSIAELEQFAKLPEKPNPIAEFEHGALICSVAFSPVDLSLVASAGWDNTIKLWNRNNASASEAPLTGHTDPVTSIVFSPKGQFLASGSLDGTIILWDVSRKQSIQDCEHRVDGTVNPVSAVTFSPDGKWLVSAGRHVKLWDVTDIYNPTEGPTLKHDNWVQAVDFSPDGKFLASGDQEGNVEIWDMQNKHTIKTLKRDSKGISTVKFSSDSRFLVTGGKDYIRLWQLPNWRLHGTIAYFSPIDASLSRYDRKVLDLAPGLAFSRDGKVLASAGGRSTKQDRIEPELELWSIENGAHITSLKGNTGFFNTVTFSSDGTTLASAGDDGIICVWEVAPYLAPQQLDTQATVRLIYFVPRDRQPQPNIRTKLDKLIKEVQQVYANEMERHGFGKKTFDFEKDESGKAVVYWVDGQDANNYYLEDTEDKIIEEYERFGDNSQNVCLFVVDISSERIDGDMIVGVNIRQGAGEVEENYALIPVSGVGFHVHTAAHELGHGFGLEHDFRGHNSSEGSYIMSYDRVPPYRLSKGAAEWLDKSRFFNHNRTFFNEPSTINQLDKTQLLFELKDADGLYQVQLAIPTTTSDFVSIGKSYLEANPTEKKRILKLLKKDETLKLYPDELLLEMHIKAQADKMTSMPGTKWKLHSYQQLKGKKTDTVRFELTTVKFELTNLSVKEVRLTAIDEHGNIAWREFNLTENSAEHPESP